MDCTNKQICTILVLLQGIGSTRTLHLTNDAIFQHSIASDASKNATAFFHAYSFMHPAQQGHCKEHMPFELHVLEYVVFLWIHESFCFALSRSWL